MRSMKILIVAGVALSVSLSAQAGHFPKFKLGKWKGTVIETLSTNMKNKTVTATTQVIERKKVLITVLREGAKGQAREEWLITPKELLHTVYDTNGKMAAQYTADYKLTKMGKEKSEELSYEIRCLQPMTKEGTKAAKQCEKNKDNNYAWFLKVQGNKLTYAIKGLKNKKDPTSLADRRTFQLEYAGKK